MQSDTTQFLSLDEVIEIHSVLIKRFGGPKGIRDPGLLESALYYRMRTGCPWRYIPTEFGQWSAIYHRFNLGSKKGVLMSLFNR